MVSTIILCCRQQRQLLESYFNECFKRNQQRGREGRYPLMYKECHEVAKEVLAANQVRFWFGGYMSWKTTLV